MTTEGINAVLLAVAIMQAVLIAIAWLSPDLLRAVAQFLIDRAEEKSAMIQARREVRAGRRAATFSD